jgi:hypothetical protein
VTEPVSFQELLRLERAVGEGVGCNRVVLIGQAPGPSTHPDLPLFPWPRNSGGGRLQRYTGCDPEAYFRQFQRINLLYKFPGHSNHPKGEDKFPMRAARIASSSIAPLLAGRRVVVVGRGVLKAFGDDLLQLEPFTWTKRAAGRGVMQLAHIPHTSGRSLFWNDAAHREQAMQFFSDVLTK